jgi:hypothetical protein
MDAAGVHIEGFDGDESIWHGGGEMADRFSPRAS